MMKLPVCLSLVVLYSLAGYPALAEQKGKGKDDVSRLTVADIYNSKRFETKRFSARWADDASGYLMLEPSKQVQQGRDIVCYDAATGDREILVPAKDLIPPGTSSPLAIDGYTFSADQSQLLIFTNSKRVWRRNTRGDYWVFDRSSRTLHQLGGDAPPSTLMFAELSPTGRCAAYVRKNDIYVEDLQSGHIRALTTSGTANVINGTFDWVYEEEFGARDGFQFSPDGKSIAYWQLDTTGVRTFSMLANSKDLYSRVVRFKYPKVGEQNSACRVGVVDVAGGPTRWLAVPGDRRNHYIPRMEWAAGSDQILVRQLNRLQNVERVMLADAITGKVKTILLEWDAAWVSVHDELNWLEDGRQFTWISDRDGWRHVYLAARSGGEPTLVTPGEMDVIRLLHVDEQHGWLYYLASPENATRCYLYRVNLDGTDARRITPADRPGSHRYDIAPGGRWAIHSFSSFDRPSVVELIGLPDHKVVRTLVDNRELCRKLDKLDRRPVEFFRVDVGDGVSVDAWCMKPPDFDPRKRYPLLLYVYGEPAGHTTGDRWGGASHLWHLMLTQHGYLVMNFDNRGTRAPRGREWRKSAYRQVGILAPADQAAALKSVLAQRDYVDGRRVGIWGASGGGSMSLNAILQYPDLYSTAMAISPVADQLGYDTVYQERYMDLPSDNAEGYKNGSPVTFAHQLEGNLLIVHGTADDNCHYRNTEMLIDALIRHNKHFTMMAYPGRSHSIREGDNTTLHLRELLTRYLFENLPAGPRKKKGG